MDSNKDEAKRCLRLAEKYLALGDREKAEKFGRKAQRLFPSQEAEGKLTFRKTREITEFLPIDEFFVRKILQNHKENSPRFFFVKSKCDFLFCFGILTCPFDLTRKTRKTQNL